jgi:hypothetical protein
MGMIVCKICSDASNRLILRQILPSTLPAEVSIYTFQIVISLLYHFHPRNLASGIISFPSHSDLTRRFRSFCFILLLYLFHRGLYSLASPQNPVLQENLFCL